MYCSGVDYISMQIFLSYLLLQRGSQTHFLKRNQRVCPVLQRESVVILMLSRMELTES